MSGTDTSKDDGRKVAVQFYCSEDEAQSIKAAAEKTLRSAASFSKFYTLKAATTINQNETVGE